MKYGIGSRYHSFPTQKQVPAGEASRKRRIIEKYGMLEGWYDWV